MSKSFQTVRGFNDINHVSCTKRSALTECFKKHALSHHFSLIDFPVIENVELFKRSVGDYSDIVNKEMFLLENKSKEVLALRPEGTASCVRAAISEGLLHNRIERLFYHGPMFRYERPQKGRLRQFHQIGLEVFGLKGVQAEIELMLIVSKVMKELGIDDKIQLEVNHLGNHQTRKAYESALRNFLMPFKEDLDPDSQIRLEHNVLRILDTKVPETQKIIEDAPLIQDFYSEIEKEELNLIMNTLDKLNIQSKHSPSMVRGLDYYTGIVFEWTTNLLGAQSAVCAGGRYDSLVEMLGGKNTPAVGLSAGVERIEALMDLSGYEQKTPSLPLYIGISGTEAFKKFFASIANFHSKCFIGSCDASLKNHLKSANKMNANIAVLAGQNEIDNNQLIIKDMHNGEQIFVQPDELLTTLNSKFEELI